MIFAVCGNHRMIAQSCTAWLDVRHEQRNSTDADERVAVVMYWHDDWFEGDLHR